MTGQRFCPGLRDLYEMADDQTADDAAGLSLDTAPLEEGIDIVGAAELTLRATPDAPTGFIVARLCDLRPDGTSAFITMGVLNLTHRGGHDRVDRMTPGQPVEAVLRSTTSPTTCRAGTGCACRSRPATGR